MGDNYYTGLLLHQIPSEQESAEIRERGDGFRSGDVGVGELDPVSDGRVVVRSDQVAQGF